MLGLADVWDATVRYMNSSQSTLKTTFEKTSCTAAVSFCSAGLAQNAIVGLNLHITKLLLLKFHLADERAMLGLEKLSR